MLTKDKVIAIQADLNAALMEIAKKHGLSKSGTRISYSSTEFKMSCNFGDTDSTGGLEIDPIAMKNLKRNAFMYGLSGDESGREFEIPGKGTCILHGLRGKNALYEIKATKKRWLGDAAMIASFVRAAKKV